MCKRFHPEVKEKPRDIWHPQYTTRVQGSQGSREVLVPVEDVVSEECPMSLIHRMPECDIMVTQVLSMMRMKEATGAVLYGTDTARWPSRWYDVVRVSQLEENRINDAEEQVQQAMR